MDISLSKLNSTERAPQIVNDITIPVYGKNKIPIDNLKFLEPNFGTNHSDNLSFCIIFYQQSCVKLF